MHPTQSSNHYQVLGLGRDASKMQVKKAYREMALKYHPDKNDQSDAKVIFNKVTSAYQVLSDDARRRQFDEECNKKEQEKQERMNRQAYKPPKPQRSANVYERQFKKEYSAPRHYPKKEKPAEEEELPKQKPESKKPEANPQPKSSYKKPYSQAKSSNTTSFFTLLIFVLVWYFFPSFSPKKPDFALTANPIYSVMAKTSSIKAPYFIRPDHNNSTNPINEETVENLYVRGLEKQCQSALNEKKSYELMAQKSIIVSQRLTLFQLANKVSTKPCRKIIKLLKKHPKLKLTSFTNKISLDH